MKVLIIGVGNMGSALARKLVSKGFDVFIWNRTLTKAEALAKELNAKVVRSIVEGVQASDLVVTFVADDNALVDVVSQVPRADGLVFVNSSTVSPATSAKVSSYLEGRGVCYVEAPVVGGPKTLISSTAIVLVAGRNQCKLLARPVLESISERMIDLGEDVRKAQALKLTFNSLLITSLEALSEAVLLSETYGVSHDVLKKLFKGTVFEPLVNKYLERILREDQEPSFRLRLAMKDLYDALLAAKEKDLSTPLIASAWSTYLLAVHKGYGDEDYSRIYKFLKK